jgi:hypothetical protein
LAKSSKRSHWSVANSCSFNNKVGTKRFVPEVRALPRQDAGMHHLPGAELEKGL